MKCFLALLLQFILVYAYSQSEEVFKVAAKNEYSLAPDLDTLVASYNYNFRLLGSREPEIVEVKFADGKAKSDTAGLRLSVNAAVPRGNRALLQIFAFKNNVKELRFEKSFYIIPQPQLPNFSTPTISTNICWDDIPLTGNDTLPLQVLTGLHSLSISRLGPKEVKVTGSNRPRPDNRQISTQYAVDTSQIDMQYAAASNSNFKIVSFRIRIPRKLEIRIKGRSNAIIMNSADNRTTKKMSEALQKLKPGSMIIIEDIHYLLFNSTTAEQVAGPYTIHIRD